jgi:hypothetical protein
VIRLAGINLIGVVAFFSIYAAAGGRRLSQGAFLASLVVFFGALTALWLRVEGSPTDGRDAVSRIGRAAAALSVVVLGLPVLVLTPLFALQETLPSDAGFHDVTRPVMVLLLISMALMVAVNLAGVFVRAGSALWAGITRRSRPGP